MATPLSITIERSRRYRATDKLRVEVDEVEQDDRFPIWDRSRSNVGYGHDSYGAGRYGYGKSLGYGDGAYGRGVYGQGADLITLETQQEFVAADYDLRARVQDEVGNLGSYSDSVVHQHRANPPEPENLLITTGTSTLVWSWSDP